MQNLNKIAHDIKNQCNNINAAMDKLELEDTGEVELINSFIPTKCPYCGNTLFHKYGKTRIGVQRYQCNSIECHQTFLPTTGTIFDEHRISISEWIEYCMNIFRNVTVNADSWNNKNAFQTSRYWLENCSFYLIPIKTT